MPPTYRGKRALCTKIGEADVLPYVAKAGTVPSRIQHPILLIPKAAPHINSCYSTYSSDLTPLADFKTPPHDLVAVPLPNGDITLRNSAGHEATFDVLGVIVDSCLEAPSGFPKYATIIPIQML